MPHPQVKNLLTISRVVVLPEFQGFNIGIKFISFIAKMYSENKRVRITTSLKPFIIALNKNKKWKCVRYGRVGKLGSNSMFGSSASKKSTSHNRITGTFEFIR